MPVYSVTNKKSGLTRVIKSRTNARALAFVADDEYEVKIIRKPVDLVKLISAGHTVEVPPDVDPTTIEDPADGQGELDVVGQ
jgi:hypothetical protein